MEFSTQIESDLASELPKPRVLLIDTNGTSRARSAIALRNVGLDVIEARDADEGFAMARSEQPNLIICDLKPETAGLIRSINEDYPPIMFAYPASSTSSSNAGREAHV